MSREVTKAQSSSRIALNFHTRISSQVMRASVACRIRKDKQTENGDAAVYLQVIINSKRTTVPLHVSWPVEKFDNKSGIFKERWKGDQEATDYNILVNKEKAKINDIMMYYRHSDMTLTVEKFKQDYDGYDNRYSFLNWMKKEIDRRKEAYLIDENTAKDDHALVKNLRRFRKDIQFSELDQYLMEEFESWCRKQDYHLNTVHRYTKRFKTYVILASKKGKNFNIQSVRNYKLPKETRRLVFLTPNELKRLESYSLSAEITEAQRKVLDLFLFCCNTGLRFSDVRQLTWKNIIDDMLEFTMHKGRSKKLKVVNVPLTDKSFGYIHSRKGPLFDSVSEQKTNKHLKEIMIKAGIRKHVTSHIARHTFATEFLRRGGHLEVLQVLLGHDDIHSTMVYVHVDKDRLREEMARME